MTTGQTDAGAIVPSSDLLAALSAIDAEWDVINNAYHRAEHFSEGSILVGGDCPAIGKALGTMWHAKERAKREANIQLCVNTAGEQEKGGEG